MKSISSFGKILFFVMMLCYSNGFFAMQAEDFAYHPVSLVTDNAHLLTEWLNKEAQGTFCPELRAATKALSKMFLDAKENEDMFVGDNFSEESLDRARYLVEAKKNKHRLHDACERVDLDEIARIVEMSPYSIQAYNYKLRFNCNERYPILYEVVARGYSLSVIETLLKMGACVNVKSSSSNSSPLFVAQTKEVARLLMKYHADINQKNCRKENCLWPVAVRMGSFKSCNHCLIDYLLKHGADVHCVDVDGRSLMQKVLSRKSKKNERISSYIIKSLLHYAGNSEQWKKSRHEIIESCIASGNTYWFKFANIQYIPFGAKSYNCTIMNYIANQGKMLRQIISYWGSPEYKSDRRIYQVAKFFSRLKNVKERTEGDGITTISTGYLFQNASYDDLAQIIGKDSVEASRKYIFEYCQQVLYYIEKYGSTDACFLVFGYDKDIAFQAVKDMIERERLWFNRGCKPYCFEQTDENGNTLLHLCAEQYQSLRIQSLRTIPWLINKGIDFTAKNNDGLTAFDLADKMEDKAILLCLIKSVQRFFLDKRSSCSSLKKYKDFLNEFFVYISRDPDMSYSWLQILFASGNIVQSFKYGWVGQLLTDQVSSDPHVSPEYSLLSYALKEEHKEVVLLLLSHGACVHQSIKTNAIPAFKDMLAKAYDSQECLICCESINDVISIPCRCFHSKQYICRKCCESLPIKKCPLCRSDLLQHLWMG